MASLITYGGGLRRIEFGLVPNENPRRVIRLGRVTVRSAKDLLAKVERLIADRLNRRPHDPDILHWLRELDEPTLAKLRKVGLVDGGVGLADTTLGAFLQRYFDSMSLKPSTQTFYGHTRRNLERHFGVDRPMRNITPADADTFRAWLSDKEKGEGLSAATVARRIIACRTLWRKAVRWRLASENVFEGIAGGHQANEARKRFISQSDIARVMEAAPDAEWRALIALARFGGLRVPSEPFALRWRDLDWSRGTLLVTCPKQAHREAYATRLVPLFPEVREALLVLFEHAEDGAEFVFEGWRGRENLRTHFNRIIKRAGLQPWPRLWHNLRASRESELMREYDLATVCKWIGNSPAIAAKHYMASIDIDTDFRRAAGADGAEPATIEPEAQQKAQQSLAIRGENDQSEVVTESTNPPGLTALDGSCSLDVSPDIARRWAQLDSNQRPADYESAALTN